MRSFFIVLSLACSLLRAASAPAADPTRVLFVGNSFTAYNDLPELVRQLGASTGHVVLKSSVAPGGFTLQNHSVNTATLAAIDAGGWDCVVLQEQSQAPAFPDFQFQQDVVPYAKLLAQRVRQYNPCARVVFYTTWGYKNGDAQNCTFFTPLCTYSGMDSMLRLRYRILADSNKAYQAPAGPVWRRIRALSPSLELYDADERHPSAAGSYAAACAFYAVLLGKNPVACTYNGGLLPADAALIRNAAKIVAFDSLVYWRQFATAPVAPVAAFNRIVNGLQVQFTSTSTGATQYQWSFGDGAAASTPNPLHAYAGPGTYTVKLRAANACGGKDSLIQTITVAKLGLPEATPFQPVQLTPNPTAGILVLQELPAATRLTLHDLSGRPLQTVISDGGPLQLDLTPLAPGSYWLRAQHAGAQQVWRIVRE